MAITHILVQAQGTGAAVSSIDYGAMILADNPVYYYRLNEVSGPTIVDSAGNLDLSYNTGTLGNPGLIKSGGYSSYNLDASNSGTAPSLLGNNSKSIELWYNLTTYEDTSMAYIGALSSNGGFCLNIGTGYLRGSFLANDLDYTVETLGLHHAVVTFDGATMRVYQDGVLGASKPTTTTTGVGSVKIGGFPNGAYHYTQSLDEVAIYDYELSLAQIQAHYNAGKP